MELEISRDEFAKNLSCTGEHLSNVISGKRNPSPQLEKQINEEFAKLLGNKQTNTQEEITEEVQNEEKPTIELKVPSIFDNFNVIERKCETETKISGIDLEKELYRNIIETFIKLVDKL